MNIVMNLMYILMNTTSGGMGRNERQEYGNTVFKAMLYCLNSYTAFSIGILSYNLSHVLALPL